MPQNTHRLVFTGGGTGGHIMPNLALIQELKNGTADKKTARHANVFCVPEILYIGEKGVMEEEMMRQHGVRFKGIVCGKMRRYFSFRNFIDFFKIPVGFIQSLIILLRFKPQKIFCTGGYVSFPVAIAGWICRIPIILHESDVTPGLAHRLCAPFAKIICVSFEESRRFFSSKKNVVVTGIPVRPDFEQASREKGLTFADITGEKPVILIMGGSQGAEFINGLVGRNLDWLARHYEVIHICGKGKQIANHERREQKNSYRCFEFVGSELKDLYAASDIIVGRAGAISLAEIGFFGKPALLVPLPSSASRNDQIENAEAFASKNVCRIVKQEEMTDEKFKKNLLELSQLFSHHSSTNNRLDVSKKIVQILTKTL